MTEENTNEVFDLDMAISSAYKEINDIPDVPTEIEEPVAEQTEQTDQGSVEEAKPAIEQPLEPHSRWSAEDKEAFKTLPRQAQEFLLRREGDVEKNLTQKSQEIAEQRKNYESIEQILAPRRQAFALEGMNETQAVQQLFALSDYASSDPAGFIKWFAGQRGVDLSSFNTNPGGDYEDDSSTAIQALQRKITELETKSLTQEQYAERARVEGVQKEIDTFKSEQDGKGNLIRPHFESVKVEMAALIKNGVAKDLQDAYERAVYANPTTRQKLLEEQRKADETARLNAAKEAASKAEKATGVQVKTKIPATSSKPGGSWEDTLMDATRNVFGAH